MTPPFHEPRGSNERLSTASLAFVTAFVTLSAQILVHRMVSLKLLNNYAFLVISLTMLGFALSGVVLTRWLPGFLAHLGDAVTMSASLFAITIIAGTAIFYHAPTSAYVAESRADFFGAFLRSIPLVLLYVPPFAFCGLILGALLSSPALSTRRIYCADLFGSACGALAVLPALGRFGAETSLLAVCALLLGSAFVFARPCRTSTRVLAPWRHF